MSDKKIDLIAQLLAKAESTTPEEAEALTAAAEKLMVKYAIDMAVIEERRAKKGEASEKVVTRFIHFKGAYRGELLHLAQCVANGLGTLRFLQNTSGNKGKVFTGYLIGFESDVDQAEILINSLQLQAAVAVRAWWKSNSSSYSIESAYNQEKARRSFVYGFGTGVGVRLIGIRLETVEESKAGTELVLANRLVKVNEYVDSQYNPKNARSRTATSGGSAAHEGREAGKRANIGSKAMTQGRGVEA